MCHAVVHEENNCGCNQKLKTLYFITNLLSGSGFGQSSVLFGSWVSCPLTTNIKSRSLTYPLALMSPSALTFIAYFQPEIARSESMLPYRKVGLQGTSYVFTTGPSPSQTTIFQAPYYKEPLKNSCMHCSFPHQLQNKLKKCGKRPKPPNTACHRTAEGISSVPGLVKVRFYLEKTRRLSRSRQQKKMECKETKSSQLGNNDHRKLIWRETISTPNQMMSLTLNK